MVKKAHKKMFNTTETQGNASQNLNDNSQKGYYQNDKQ